jgi:xanthine dehydrogenase accessory factor
VAIAPTDTGAGWRNDAFYVVYAPRVRIVAMGQGDTLTATARLARFFGAEVHAFSPSPDDVAAVSAEGIAATLLENRTLAPTLETDPWTAFAFLFHEHDWEEMLLPWALQQPHLFIGAIGGRHSRANTLNMLRDKNLDESHLERFRMPAGLIPEARDPATLSLSIVSEIIGEYHAKLHRAGPGERSSRMVETLGSWD